MSRKNFKDNTANINRFFTEPEFQKKTIADVKAKFKTADMPETAKTSETAKTPYRLTLRLRPEYKEYLEQAAWKSKKNVTEYLNDLIAADMGKNT